MILEEETYKKFGYYPNALSPHSAKKIIVKCDDCGKIRENDKGSYRSLCQSCANKGIKKSDCFIEVAKERFKGKNNPQWKGGMDKYICCECHKGFERYFSNIKKENTKLFCSRECYAKWQSKQIKEKCRFWNGGMSRHICFQCGKEFYAYLSEKRIFCSRKCTSKWRSKNKKILRHLQIIGAAQKPPTKPELIFKEICKKCNLPFKYTGNGDFWIHNINPDFIETNGKKIAIEIFGDYWHGPLLNYNLKENKTLEYRKKALKRYGWKLIVFWETDLKRADAEEFVMHKLRKEKVIN